jgi:hypothetical protein
VATDARYRPLLVRAGGFRGLDLGWDHDRDLVDQSLDDSRFAP